MLILAVNFNLNSTSFSSLPVQVDKADSSLIYSSCYQAATARLGLVMPSAV